MWPIPRMNQEIISCTFTPRHLALAHIVADHQSPLLNAYTRITLRNAELEYAILCNPTLITNTIQRFIEHHASFDCLTQFAICGPTIHEKITNKKIESAQSSYLYTHNNKDFHYTASIAPAALAQYSLIALRHRLPLQTITTPFMAQLKLYQILQGNQFRYTEFAAQLRMHHHHIDQIIATADVIKHMHVAPHVTFDLVNEHYFLVSSLGLYYLRR